MEITNYKWIEEEETDTKFHIYGRETRSKPKVKKNSVKYVRQKEEKWIVFLCSFSVSQQILFIVISIYPTVQDTHDCQGHKSLLMSSGNIKKGQNYVSNLEMHFNPL